MKRALLSLTVLLALVVGAWLGLHRTSGAAAPTTAAKASRVLAEPQPRSGAVAVPPTSAASAAGDLATALESAARVFGAYEQVAASQPTSTDDESGEAVTILRTSFKYPLVRITAKRSGTKADETVSGAMIADHVVVRPTETIDPVAFASRIQALGFSVRRHNPRAGTYLLAFPLTAGRTDDLDHALARLVETEDAVAWAEPDFIVTASALPPGETAVADGRLWALNNTGRSGGVAGADIDATAAWAVSNDASGVVVAVIDSGIHLSHTDLAANLWVNTAEIPGNGIDDDNNGVIDDVHGFNAYAGDGNPDDDNGHGTHCAGTIAADGHNATGVVGVAWRSRLMALKFLSAGGVGVTSDAIESIDYAIDHGAHVLNLSWGGGGFSASLLAALERARAAGLVVIAAAGNDARNNDNSPVYPASHDLDNIVAVAATDRRDALAWFSNYGPARVHLAAPGAEILSTWIGDDAATKVLSGSSMAAAQVSGATALLAARFPEDTYRHRINRLLGGAETVADLPVARSGRLNLLNPLTTALPSPANDRFADAPASALNGVIWHGDNTHATAEPGEPAHVSGGAQHSVWYRWTAPVAGQVTLGFSPAFSARVSVYTGSSVSALTPLVSTTAATATFTASAGATYHLAVDSNAGATGSFTLSVSIPPTNDHKAHATVLSGESWSVTGTNLGASREAGETAHANVPGGRSVWWRWTAPLDGPLRVGTAGSDFDTTLAVYDDAGVQGFIQGEQPDVVLVIDVSGSTNDTVKGGYVGDTNGDGRANTILDAEVAAALAMIQTLRDTGKPARVAIVKFGDTATLLDMNPAAPGIQPFTTPTADTDANGVPDVVQALRTLRAGGVTNYTDALTKAGDAFAAMGTVAGEGNVVFLSDGKPSDSGNFGAVASDLRDAGHRLHAFGAGGGSSLASLQLITPQASIFTHVPELIAVFNGAVATNDDHAGLLTSEVNFSARAGHTYSIAVDGYKGAAGTIQLAAQYSQSIEIVGQPRNTSVERFAPARFEVVARGVAPFNYQWFKNGQLIPDATASALVIDRADVANRGSYHVVINNTFATVTSRTVTLDVIVREPVITRDLDNQTVVAGSQVVFRANAVGTAPFTYQWFRNGEVIDGATQGELLIPSVSATHAGTYHVVITNESGVTTSRTVFLKLADNPFDAWVRRSPQFAPHGVTDVMFVGGKFIVFGAKGLIATSVDGLTWTDAKVPGGYFGENDTRNISFQQVRYFDGTFVALGQSGPSVGLVRTLHRSLDGITWEALPNPHNIYRLDYLDGVYVGFGNDATGRSTYFASADLETWAPVGQFTYEETPLIATGATWKYLPATSGYPTGWTSVSFDDSAWASGPAPLGYGDNPHTTTVPSEPVTTLFRLTFPSSKTYNNARIVGRLLADDGALIYFNGGIVHRQNMSSQWPSAYERAATDIAGDAESTFVEFNGLYSSYAVQTTNVFAVQVHQSTADPSDMVFDMDAVAVASYQTAGPTAGNGRMVVLRGDGKAFTSPDGLNWTRHDNTGLDNAAPDQFVPPNNLVFINNEFLAWETFNSRLYRSTDGVNWTLHTRNANMTKYQWDGQRYFSIGNAIRTSLDAITWDLRIVPVIYGSDLRPTAGTFGNGVYVVVNSAGYSATVPALADITGSLMSLTNSQGRRLRILNGSLVSIADNDNTTDSRTRVTHDGATWQAVLGPLSDLSYGNHTYLRFETATPQLAYDLAPYAEGSPWTASIDPRIPDFTPRSHVFANGLFVAVGDKGAIATSPDGKVWTSARAAVTTDPNLTRIDHLGGRFVAIGTAGLVLTSTDAVTWTRGVLPTTAILKGVAFDGTRYVIGTSLATETEFFTSTNATTWTRVAAGAYGAVRDIAHGNGHFAAVTGRRVVFSTDGSSWAAADLLNDEGWAIAHYKGTFVVVGNKGSVLQSGSVQNTPPAPVLTGIEKGATFTANDLIRIDVTGAASGSEIVAVDVFLNGELVSHLEGGPYTWSSTAGLPGDYRLSVAARDAAGNVSFTHTTYTVNFSPWQRVSPNLPVFFVNTFTAPDGTHYGLGVETRSVGKNSVLARSHDGLDWRMVYAGENDNALVRMAASDNGTLVAAGNDAHLLTSFDGETWRRTPMPLGNLRVAWGNGLFVAIPFANPSVAFVSADGLAWDQVDIGYRVFGESVFDFIFHEGRFLVVTRGTQVFESTNGLSWSAVTMPLEGGFSTPKFVVGDGKLCIHSLDIFEFAGGNTWTKLPRPLGMVLGKLSFGDGRFVGSHANGLIVSSDLLAWTQTYTATQEYDPLTLAHLAWLGDRWLACRQSSSEPYVATSTDTASWHKRLFVDTSVSQRTTQSGIGALATDGEQLLGVGSLGLFLRSTDGRVWEQQPYIGPESLTSLIYAEDKWVAAGQTGAVYTSPDGVVWTKRATGTTRLLQRILHDGNRFIILGDQVLLTSDDAETWTALTSVDGVALPYLSYGMVTRGRFAVMGTGRYLYTSPDGIDWQRTDIILTPAEHGYRMVDTPTGVLIPGGYSGLYGSYIMRSDDLVTWTPDYRPMPPIYQPAASLGNTRFATQTGSNGGFQFSRDNGATWFRVSNYWSYASVVAFKGSYYASSFDRRIDEFSLVDLRAENPLVTTDASPGPGSDVTIQWEVVNSGYVDLSVSRPIRIEARLGRTPAVFHPTDLVIVDETFTDSLAAGESLNFSRNVSLPPDVAPGHYYLKIRVDGSSKLSELNETNNLLLPAAPAFTVQSWTLSVTQTPGGVVRGGQSAPLGSLSTSRQRTASSFTTLGARTVLAHRSMVDLFAVPDKGFGFVGWLEHPSQPFESLSLEMTRDHSVTPLFSPLRSITTSVQGQGRVAINPDDGTYMDGDIVHLHAIPAAGWRFAGWSGDLTGTNATATFTVSADLAATATFAPIGVTRAAWRETHFGADGATPAIAGDLADPDGDGIANLLEYALGGDPLDPDHAPLWTGSLRNHEFVLTYTVDPQATEVSVVAETTRNLSDPLSWSSAGITLEVVAETPTAQTIEARIPLTSAPRFMRLRVGVQP